ncbi:MULTISPECIES: DUF2000 family protein [Cohaesibacter]|uniref:DUF2000 family protein n=1 Tax=Cohaesibacter TaxID=655352 RepID=UPI000DE93767|nr:MULTISPECIES: DUF2000 family protein [Cohaesibacter]TLP47132.1 DUF2000 family protein [Cohaesibacter sp. CAU 1516]
MFDTKICIVVREDLEIWQKLNVTAFLMSGITGANPGIIGAAYIDDQNNAHLPMSVQPVIVLSATASQLATIRKRAQSRDVATVAYIEEMFATGHDAANRAVFADHGPDELNTVGIALRADKKIVDKITKGAKMHG